MDCCGPGRGSWGNRKIFDQFAAGEDKLPLADVDHESSGSFPDWLYCRDQHGKSMAGNVDFILEDRRLRGIHHFFHLFFGGMEFVGEWKNHTRRGLHSTQRAALPPRRRAGPGFGAPAGKSVKRDFVPARTKLVLESPSSAYVTVSAGGGFFL